MTATVRPATRPEATVVGRDRVWLWIFVGVPAFLHITLVWIPAIITGVLSFTAWDNLAPLSAIRFVGFANYWEIFTIFDNRLFPALFNNFVLLLWLFVCSAIGMLFAYLLDKNLRGGRFYQSVFYFPVVLSLAVVGFMWKSVMFSRDRGLLEHDLARRLRSTSSATRPRSSRSTCRCSTSRLASRATSPPC